MDSQKHDIYISYRRTAYDTANFIALKLRYAGCLLLICMSVHICHAQNNVIQDQELASLVDVVKLLRVQNEKNYNEATKILKADNKWTPMNETGKLKDTECKPSKKTPNFKLNRILTSVARERKYISAKGEMLNGEDERYHYSLYERSLKKKSEATYRLRNRSGKQVFVIVPFNKQKGSLSVMVNGENLSSTKEAEDGTLICNFIANGSEIYLTVKNLSTNPLAFVIINHNSRKI